MNALILISSFLRKWWFAGRYHFIQYSLAVTVCFFLATWVNPTYAGPPSSTQSEVAGIETQRLPPTKKTEPISVNELKSSDWWTTVQKEISEQEYNITYQGKSHLPELREAYSAPNRAQNLRAYFTSQGIKIIRRTEANPTWQVGLELVGLARGDRIISLSEDKAPVVAGRGIEYHRGLLVEWYENRPEGLEQGFTIKERLEGEGNLELVFRIDGNTRATVSDDGKAIDFLTSLNARVLRYSDLAVIDSVGKSIPSHLELANDALRIVVNDSSANYPITVDPLLTTPSWTVESNQADAEFGYSVSTAGDVNGDGYSDVIIGAPYYDNGQSYEGIAFVYLGSASGLSTSAAWEDEGNQFGAHFGYSVGTAGDVNGDGYSDVIVGADVYDNGERYEGRAFVYHGSASGLIKPAAWEDEGNQFGAHFGCSVGTAGDVNGDGYSDVIVGADGYENGENDEGRAFVYYGSASGLIKPAAWEDEGNQFGAHFGCSVGTAGDVNGDGYSDVIIGAPGYENGEEGEGKVFVYYGSSSGLIKPAAWTEEGDQSAARFGSSVSTAGDVNGDGYSDVIIGAPYDQEYGTWKGRVFVYYGSASGLIKPAAWEDEGNQVDAYFGRSVGTAGDVNGDGYSDVIIGAPFYDNGEDDEGKVFVYYGSASGLIKPAAWTEEGNQNHAHYGSSVSTAGDVNGDGYSDVIVGAPWYDNGEDDEGRAFVYYGSASGVIKPAAWTEEGNQYYASFGSSVGTAGDVNGDGYSDVIIGAPGYDNGEEGEGKVFVYYGSSSGLTKLAAWTEEGNQHYVSFGYSVGAAGDVNGDGYSDVIIGAPYDQEYGTWKGRVFVYYGSASGLIKPAAWTEEGNQYYAHFGYSVGTAGDVNGDGYSDVIIGAPYDDNGERYEGRAFVYHGSSSGLIKPAAWEEEGNEVNGYFGSSVGTAGDVNGDGYSDVIVGANGFVNGESWKGRAFVYYGSASGLITPAAWTEEGNQIGARFGSSVGTAGDVNGDGYSDVIVGAPYYDNGEDDEGRVFVYLGSASDLTKPTAWTDEGNQIGARFGYSVGTAGDVNGDGYSDVIVGAPYYDSGEDGEGRVFVYLGSASDLTKPTAWTDEGNQIGARFGYSVGTAGDVNGDGYSDVIVGAPYYDSGEDGEGMAFVYYGNSRDNLDVKPRQVCTDGATPIAHLGMSDSETSFVISALGRSLMGRNKVKLEWEVKPAGTPFDGAGTSISVDWQDTGTEGYVFSELVTGLIGHTAYRWRVRFLYPPSNPMGQVASRWFYPFPGNLAGAYLRTNNTPPNAGFTEAGLIPAHQVSQSTEGDAKMTMQFRIQDGGQNLCTLNTFQYSVDGGSNWKTPANGDASDCLGGGWPDNGGARYSSALDWSGTVHSITFDTKHSDILGDFDGADQSDVKVRFMTNDGLADSNSPTTSENFRVVQVPPAKGTITITDDNGTTNDATPDLTLSSAGAAFMRFALKEGELSSAIWVPYGTTYSEFNISPGGNGEKRVWVEFKDVFGNIQTNHASDTTYYDTSPQVTSARAITNSKTPRWEWTSGGGSGTYRYRLDDGDWLDPTIKTWYEPPFELRQRFHTLGVQELNEEEEWWSDSGSFQIEIDSGKPCSEAASPLVVDDQGKTFSVTYSFDDVYDIAGETCGTKDSGSGVAKVELYVQTPGQSGYTLADTDLEGSIEGSFQYTVTDEGAYRFYTLATDKAGNVEDDLPSQGYDAETIYASQFSGYAILAVGAILGNEGLESHTLTANNVYSHLINRNFALVDNPVERWDDPLDHIKYFNPYGEIQTGEDDYSEGDSVSYWTAMQRAITQWALNKMKVLPGPLYIILIDHGTPDKLYLTATMDLTVNELNEWLDILELGMADEGIDEDIVIILGTCYSGSFIYELSGPGRIIVASTAEDEPSYRGAQEPSGVRDGEFFISSLFNELAQGYNLKLSFQRAVQRTESHTDSGATNSPRPYFDTAMQHPHLDDNWDGVGSNTLFPGGDGDVVESITLGYGTSAPEPLVITEVGNNPQVPLASTEHQALVWARVSNHDNTDSVWVEIRKPDVTLEGGTEQQVVDLIERSLSWNQTENRYELTYNDFWNSGKYTLFFYAKDTTGIISPSATAYVYKETDRSNNPPVAFSLVNPEDGAATTTSAGLGAAWQRSVDPDGDPVTYTLEIWSDPPADSRRGTATFYYKREGLAENICVAGSEAGFVDLRSYQWQVTAVDQYGAETASTEVWRFDIDDTNPLLGWVVGLVYDATTEEPIPEVQLSAVGINFALPGDGWYVGTGPAGPYTVTISANGYEAEEEEVDIPEGGFAARKFGLAPRPVATPTFLPPPGTYSTAQSVELSCDTTGATIRYTTDGSEPTEQSQPCSGTIDISVSTTLKAKAFKAGWIPSTTATGDYVITLDSDGDGMPNEWEILHRLNPYVDDAQEDPDVDGFVNLVEYQRQTDPNDQDSHPPRAMPWIPLLLLDD